MVFTDFQKLSAAHLENADALFLALAQLIADQLDTGRLSPAGLERRPGAERQLRAVSPARGAQQDARIPCVGWMRSTGCSPAPFGSDLFALFRSWHNERSARIQAVPGDG